MNTAAKTKKIFDGRYEILSIVGRGARSVVYHARLVSQPHMEVAIKVLSSGLANAKGTEELKREAMAMISARHKYVIRLDDFHSTDAYSYLSMEYASQGDLRKLRSSKGEISIQQAERFLIQIAEALDFIHSVGMLHRDVKPDNILILNDRNARLGDFGVAVLPGEESSLEQLKRGVGTMDYMAPEVLKGSGYTSRSDLYALGVTFYEILSGKHPFADAPLAEQISSREDANIKHPSSINPLIPRYLSETLIQTMSFDPELRFASGRDLVQSLLINKSKSISDMAADQTLAKAKSAAEAEESGRAKKGKSSPPEKKSEPASKSNKSKNTAPAPKKEEQPIAAAPKEVEKAPAPPRQRPERATVRAPHELSPILEELRKRGEIPQKKKNQDTAKASPAKNFDTPLEAVLERPSKPIHPAQKPHSVERTPAGNAAAGTNLTSATRAPVDYSQYTGLFVFAIGAIAALYVSMRVLSALLGGSSGEDSQNVVASISQSPLPQYDGSKLNFPHLPSGVFSGTISGIHPTRAVPFSILSDANVSMMTILLGLEGWTPVTVQLSKLSEKELPNDHTIRISGNGFIFKLSADSFGDKVTGTAENLVTKEKGVWHLKSSS